VISFGKEPRLELPSQLEALREAIEIAEGRLDESHVAFGRHVVAKADDRLRHGTSHTLAAMLGATGSGKSTLTNALVGSTVATTGVRRPTTSSTLACVWGNDEDFEAGTPLLDWLEVASRHFVGSDPLLNGLVLLDVPDHDSVVVSHRLEMERIAEHADLFIWVTDPEKYADAALHRYLRFLAGHEAVTLVVLNKADQLSPQDLAACKADLTRLLANDGLKSAEVIALSALTGDGVDRLVADLGEAVQAQRAVVDRLRADVSVAASELAADAGRSKEAKIRNRDIDTLADGLVGATGIDAVTDAVAGGTRRDAAAAMGWPFTRWAAKLRPHPLRRLHLDRGSAGRTSLPSPSGSQLVRAEGAVRSFTDQLVDGLDAPWPAVVRQAGTPDRDVLRDRLDTAVANAVRTHNQAKPKWWAGIGALQWLLALAVVAGFVWLAVLFALDWFRVPDPPTPQLFGIAVPTLAMLGGVALGLVLSFIGRKLATISAKRAARSARKAAAANVRAVAEELIVEPVKAELAGRDRLLNLLREAGADPRFVADTARAL